MPSYEVQTPHESYQAIVERGILMRAGEHLPEKTGKVFVITAEDVWRHHGAKLEHGLAGRPHTTLFFPGGEERKRLASVEALADQMVSECGDRSSMIVAFGGGIVTDLGGFLAAIFMRGIPVLQVPTTLLAQVDAGVGGKTGVNLVSGKNLIGAFYQPLATLIDPDVLATLSNREYRAGLFEVIKCGIIRSPGLFRLLVEKREEVLARKPDIVLEMIGESVRIKAEVVSADERESGLRRILNFGHTIGHALESETGYSRYLHGEAVAFGMKAAAYLARKTGHLPESELAAILDAITLYGPVPPPYGIPAERLLARLKNDKKTLQGSVHFVLPEKIGQATVVSGIREPLVLSAIQAALK
jgi:3-dehydroquinate synthase